jgi:hypothetical protein
MARKSGPPTLVRVPVTLMLRRLGYRVAYRVLQAFWFVARPSKQGVKCLVTCHDRVLLVRHTYGNRSWDVPAAASATGATSSTAFALRRASRR